VESSGRRNDLDGDELLNRAEGGAAGADRFWPPVRNLKEKKGLLKRAAERKRVPNSPWRGLIGERNLMSPRRDFAGD